MEFFFRQIISAFGVFFRTIKAFFNRRIMGITSRFRQLTNISRNATRVAASSVQEVAAAVKKPTKREDYIETQRLFISKSFVIFLVIGAILLGLFIYYVAWPFVLSHFLTARFYCQDKRVPDWTGKVIVYADKSKKIPMYEGRLEEGVLQGRGREYDDEGLLTYDGNFISGVRSGAGTGYEAGILIYEGQYENGLYQGTGTLYEDGKPLYSGKFEEGVYQGAGTLYEDGEIKYSGAFVKGVPEGAGTDYVDGEKHYEGTFSNGLYEGEGTIRDTGGALIYRGGFSEGLYEGEGTLYAPDGSVIYKGGFSKGLYSGQGVLYEDGSLLYTGGFAEGLYEGEGTVTLASGDKITTEFSAGVGTGLLELNKDNRLWYEGGAVDLTPDGYGEIHSESGKVIYAGQMDMGSVDGGWLLGLSAQEVRDAFAEASVTETDRDGGGFLIINNDLNLTVLCTFKNESDDPRPHRIWLMPDAGSTNESLLPWSTREEAETWAEQGHDEDLTRSFRSQGKIFMPDGGQRGDWYQSVYCYTDHSRALVCAEDDAAPFGILWAQPGGSDVAEGGEVDSMVSEAQERLDSLLEAIDKVSVEKEPTGNGGSGSDGSGTGDNGGGSGTGTGSGDNGGGSGSGTGDNGSGSGSGTGSGDNGGGSGTGTGTGDNGGGSGTGTGTADNGSGSGSGSGTGDNGGGSGTGTGTGDNGSGSGSGSGSGDNGSGSGTGTGSGDNGGGSGAGTGSGDNGGGTGAGTGTGDNGSGSGTGTGSGDNGGGSDSGTGTGDNGGGSGTGTGSGDNGGGTGTGTGSGDNGGGTGTGTGSGDNGGGSGAGIGSGDNGGGSGTGTGTGDNGGGSGTGTGTGDNGGGSGTGTGSGDDSGGSGTGSDDNGAGSGAGTGSGDNPGGSGAGAGSNPAAGGNSSGAGGDGSELPPLEAAEMLNSVKNLTQAFDLMNALINSYTYDQAITALETARPLRVQVLAEQQKLFDMGSITEDDLKPTQDALDDLDHQLYQYRIMREQARVTVETLTGMSMDGKDKSVVMLVTDATKLDVDRLYADSLSYAKAIAAERYEVDATQLLIDVKVQVLDLTIAYDKIDIGKKTLQRSLEAYETVSDSYARGAAEKTDLYTAQCTVDDAVSSLFQSIGSYTTTFNKLNNLSGGWMAREYDWFAEPFAGLRAASIEQAEKEAEDAKKAADEAAQKAAEEAAKKLEEEKKKEEEESDGSETGNPG